MTEFTVEKRLIEAKVRGQSLIAVMSKRPVEWGNYFNMSEGNVINMWSENLQYLVDTGILNDGMVECFVYTLAEKTRYVLITDNRVPIEYFNHESILNGRWKVNSEIAEHVMSYINFIQKDVD